MTLAMNATTFRLDSQNTTAKSDSRNLKNHFLEFWMYADSLELITIHTKKNDWKKFLFYSDEWLID